MRRARPERGLPRLRAALRSRVRRCRPAVDARSRTTRRRPRTRGARMSAAGALIPHAAGTAGMNWAVGALAGAGAGRDRRVRRRRTSRYGEATIAPVSATRPTVAMIRSATVTTSTNGPVSASANSTKGPASRMTGAPTTGTDSTSGRISPAMSALVGGSEDMLSGWASSETSGVLISSVVFIRQGSSGTRGVSSVQVPRRVPSQGARGPRRDALGSHYAAISREASAVARPSSNAVWSPSCRTSPSLCETLFSVQARAALRSARSSERSRPTS